MFLVLLLLFSFFALSKQKALTQAGNAIATREQYNMLEGIEAVRYYLMQKHHWLLFVYVRGTLTLFDSYEARATSSCMACRGSKHRHVLPLQPYENGCEA